MKYTKLGSTDLSVSRICMGCMGFGDAKRGQHSWTIDEEHSREIIKRGLDLGVNFYDTAIGYQSGTSEQYVGRALRDFAGRDEVVVATKFLPRTPEEIERGISGQQHIENMINTSLKNLGMDYVDLYIYHIWDWNTPIFDILDGLNRVVKAGKARYIGISNCFAWQLAKANALAEKEGFARFVSIQGHYNLIFREEEREMVPYCDEENIALTPYSALASGRLSRLPGEGGTKRAAEDTYAKFKYDATADQDNVIISRVAELAEKHEVSMTEVSLAWLLTRATSPVVGATKLHHIEGAAKAVDLELSDSELAYLEEPYVPHPLAGVMAQNRKASAKEKHVWTTGSQKTEDIPEPAEKDKYQNSICFPIGEENPYGAFFVGQSYLAPVSTEQIPVFNVTFEPGCRNNWHVHHAEKGGGQMLICVGGRGYYQEWGKEAVEMTPGTVINIPAGVKHWHGAAPDSWFSHLAIEIEGEATGNEWLEAVSDEDYNRLK